MVSLSSSSISSLLESFEIRSRKPPLQRSPCRLISCCSCSKTGSVSVKEFVEKETVMKSVKNRARAMAESFCNLAESVIDAMEPSIRTRMMDPAVQLADNFFPLSAESPPQPCLDIRGEIPHCLNGIYIRNGPNPSYLPRAGYHYFDGDGMLHAIRIQDGKATHCCRYIQTNRFIHEQAAGRPLFVKALGELHGWTGLARLSLLRFRHMLGLIKIEHGIGTANAGLAYFNGRLLAMSEDDKPYAIRIADNGDLLTFGRLGFSESLKNSMTAHPKMDPFTREMFSFHYDLLMQPYLNYFIVSPDGKKGPDVPIHLTEPTLVHDFAITERYAVFTEHQIVFRLQEMFWGRSAIVCDQNKVSRVGIIPRYDKDDSRMKWFDAPGCTIFHYLNAWEEGDEVVMVGSINAPIEAVFACPENLECRLHELRFNMKTGESQKQQVSSANIDVGRINERYMGRKTRYAYMSISGPWPKFCGVAKVDLEAPRVSPMPNATGINTNDLCLVGWRKFGEGGYGSEPLFVPRRVESYCSEAADEDDGYVLCFVHNENYGESELLVMDARSPTLKTVAAIKMPCRIPYGFHGIFIGEQELAMQNAIPI